MHGACPLPARYRYTRGEQDVIETVFPAAGVRDADDAAAPEGGSKDEAPSKDGTLEPTSVGTARHGETRLSAAALEPTSATLPKHVHHGLPGLFVAHLARNVSFGPECARVVESARRAPGYARGYHLWACCDGTPCEVARASCEALRTPSECRHHSMRGAPCRWSREDATCKAPVERYQPVVGLLPECSDW